MDRSCATLGITEGDRHPANRRLSRRFAAANFGLSELRGGGGAFKCLTAGKHCVQAIGDASVVRDGVTTADGICLQLALFISLSSLDAFDELARGRISRTPAVPARLRYACGRGNDNAERRCTLEPPWKYRSVRQALMRQRVTPSTVVLRLGLRRGGVTDPGLKLQRADLIRHARGHITVLDRPAWRRRGSDWVRLL